MGHLGKLTKVNEAIQLYVNFLTKFFCSLGDIFLSIGSQSQHYWSGKSIVRLVLRLLLCIYVKAKLVTGILQCHIQDEPLKCNNGRHDRIFQGRKRFNSTAVGRTWFFFIVVKDFYGGYWFEFSCWWKTNNSNIGQCGQLLRLVVRLLLRIYVVA